ncbi:hypothetical protein K402DRAFT_295350, partial [Aulographum hederae CBS 113979]
YDALSYAWESDKGTTIIQVDGHHLQVTRNLAHALRRLRRPGVARTLWVDAICINQSDNEEKSRQVGMMKNIYESASFVLIWLGPEPD